MEKYSGIIDERFYSTVGKPSITGPNGWLDRDGKFYRCTGWQHIQLASDLGYKEGELEELGWIKIADEKVFPGYSSKQNKIVRPSQKQIDVLWDWFVKRNMGKKFPKWILDENVSENEILRELGFGDWEDLK